MANFLEIPGWISQASRTEARSTQTTAVTLATGTPLLVGLACGSAAVLVSGERQPLVFLWPFFYLFLLPDLNMRLRHRLTARR